MSGSCIKVAPTKKVCSVCKKHRFKGEFYGYTDWCLECSRDLIAKHAIIRSIKEDLGIDLEQPNRMRAVMESVDEGRCHPDLAKKLGVKTGEHPCGICGMRHWKRVGADECCRPALDEYWDDYTSNLYKRARMANHVACIVDHSALCGALALMAGGTGAGGVGYEKTWKLTGIPSSTLQRWAAETSYWVTQKSYDRLTSALKGPPPGVVLWPLGEPAPPGVQEVEKSPEFRARVERRMRALSAAISRQSVQAAGIED